MSIVQRAKELASFGLIHHANKVKIILRKVIKDKTILT